jgi:hypothetical protein
MRNERIAVGALFEGESQRKAFHYLRENRDAIEAEIGAKLVWTHGPNLGVCEIVLRNPVDPNHEALWKTYFDWMRRSLETFQRVLGPRLANGLPHKDPHSTGNTSITRALYVDYWSALRDWLIQNQSTVKSHKPLPQHWTTFAIGRSGAHLDAVASVSKEEIRVELILGGPLAKPPFTFCSRTDPPSRRSWG